MPTLSLRREAAIILFLLAALAVLWTWLNRPVSITYNNNEEYEIALEHYRQMEEVMQEALNRTTQEERQLEEVVKQTQERLGKALQEERQLEEAIKLTQDLLNKTLQEERQLEDVTKQTQSLLNKTTQEKGELEDIIKQTTGLLNKTLEQELIHTQQQISDALDKALPPNALLRKSNSKLIIMSGTVDGTESIMNTPIRGTDWLNYALPGVPRIIYNRVNNVTNIKFSYSGTRTIIAGINETLYTIPNKGNEALAYLRYCYDYYDSLPDFSIFLHGHEQSTTHSRHIQYYLQDLDTNYFNSSIPITQIVNLNFDVKRNPKLDWQIYQSYDTSRDAKQFAMKVLKPKWSVVEKWFGSLPKKISFYCCAQFVVTRAGIRRRSKEFYLENYEWLENSAASDSVSTSRLYEYLWYLIFTGEVNYPQVHPCEYLRNKNCREYTTMNGVVDTKKDPKH